MTPTGLSTDVIIVNELGLHARAAAKLAQVAGGARSAVWVARGPERADATSILDILMLACEKGTRLTLAVEDPEDRHVLDALVQLFESGFGE